MILFFLSIFVHNGGKNKINCTFDDPCSYSLINESHVNKTEIYVIDKDISSQSHIESFFDLIHCSIAQNNSIIGMNQTIVFDHRTYNQSAFQIIVNNKQLLNISNFTFIGIKSNLMNANSGEIILNNISIYKSSSSIINAQQNSIILMQNCKFLTCKLSGTSIANLHNSKITFEKCTFFAISHIPVSNSSTITAFQSSIVLNDCSMSSNYVILSFFDVAKSNLTLLNTSIDKNCGNNIVTLQNNSISNIKNCIFVSNSLSFINASFSAIHIVNTTISRTCTKETIITSNSSTIKLEKSLVLFNSCGQIIQSYSTQFRIIESNITGNISPSNIMSLASSDVYAENSTFLNNTAADGSVIHIVESKSEIRKSVFINCFSRSKGSALLVLQSDFSCYETNFINSTAIDQGATIFGNNNTEFNIHQCQFNNSYYHSIISTEGNIVNCIFSSEIGKELSSNLHQSNVNCSFAEPKIRFTESNEAEVIESNGYFICIVFFCMFVIICFIMRKKIIRIYRRIKSKFYHSSLN